MLGVAIACLVLALPGLCLRRSGRLPARLAAGLALAVLFAAVLDPRTEQQLERPARLVLVTTGADSAATTAAVAERFGRGVDLEVLSGTDQLAERVAEAWLRPVAAGRSRAVALVWDGPFEPRAAAGVVAEDTASLTSTPPPLLEPEACQVRVVGPLEAGRPGGLEVEVPRLRFDVAGTLAVSGPGGEVLETMDLDAAALRARGRAVVWVEPESPGRHGFELVLQVAGSRLVARGEFAVTEPRRVLVVGRDAVSLASALRVQGLAVETAAALPTEYDHAVLVLLDRLDPPAQQRVAARVAAGGGVFLVGAPDGGALPAVGQPLHDLLPVTVELPAASTAPPGYESGAPGPVTPPETEPPEPPVPPTGPPPALPTTGEPPPPPPGPVPDPARAEDLASGDTTGARVVDGPEVEVDRRTVAMVLVVDRSDSMNQTAGGVSKIQYAKTSAFETAKALHDGDVVGVVTFGKNGRVVLPLTVATDLDRIRGSLEGVSAFDESTLLADALAKAAQLLGDSTAAVRHIVVISDGEIHDAKEPAPLAPLAAAAAREEGYTVSLIQIAGSTSALAKPAARIAELGGGVFRRADNPAQIPRLVSMEVSTTLGRVGRVPGGETETGLPPPAGDTGAAGPDPAESSSPPAEPARGDPEREPAGPPPPPSEAAEEPPGLEVIAVAPSPLLEPQQAEFPRVGGVVSVAARRDAHVLLLARRDDEGVPLLAFANRGLGKVGVWSSDLLGEWGRGWRDSPSLPARLAQWVSALMPPLSDPGAAALEQAVELVPPAPVRRERDALAALTGRPLLPLDEFEPPPPDRSVEQRSHAVDLALPGLLAIFLVVLVEFLVVRLRR